MRPISRFAKRLAELEGVNPERAIVLHFDDGSSRAFHFRRRSELELFSAASALAHWLLFPSEYTPEKLKAQRARKDVLPDALDNDDPQTGRPISRFDKLFPLLMNAAKIASGRMLRMGWGALVHVREVQRRGNRFACTREGLESDPYYKCVGKGDFTGYFQGFRGDCWRQVSEPSSDSQPDVPTPQNIESQ